MDQEAFQKYNQQFADHYLRFFKHPLVFIFLGYLLAGMAGFTAVVVNDLFLDPIALRQSSGMTAFGDLVLFITVSGLVSLIPTCFLFYWIVKRLRARSMPMRAFFLGLFIVLTVRAGAEEALRPHNSMSMMTGGKGESQYWIFLPSEPAPASAPVVVFCHGWGVFEPALYGAWIEHLAQRGNIVIYPRFQEGFRMKNRPVTESALAAVQAALQRLNDEGPTKPDRGRMAVVGHSLGGVVAANLAASPEQLRVSAVMSVEPGKTWERNAKNKFLDLSRIPASVLLVSISGDRDRVVKDTDAKNVYRLSTSVPAANKSYLMFQSGTGADASLIADHNFPTAAAASDKIPQARSGFRPRKRSRETADGHAALDAYDQALWALFDALCDAAFFGKDRATGLGHTPPAGVRQLWSVKDSD